MSEKTRKVNIDPYHCELTANSEGFELSFFDRTEGGVRLEYVLRMEFWWVRILAQMFWKAIDARQADVDHAKQAMERAK